MIPINKSPILQGMSAFKKRIGNNIRSKRNVFLGNPIATGTIYADTNKTLVYVHGLGNEPDSITTIAASGIPKDKLIYKQPVLIEQTGNGNWRFYGLDTEADQQFSAGITSTQDQTPVKLSQLDYGTLHPYSGLVLLVKGAVYGNNYVGDTLTADFSTGTVQDTGGSNITIPTTNNRAKAILIQVEPGSGTLSYKQSSEFVATVSLPQAYNSGLLPLPDGGRYRKGYAKLVKGITAFNYSHLWVVPEFLTKGDGSFPISLDYALTIVTNTQRVTANFTIASGGSLTIDGRLTIL